MPDHTPDKETKPFYRRRARGFRAIGPDVARLIKPLFGQRGFAGAEIVTEWPRIVGADIARDSIPEKIQFPKGKRAGGTLHLRVRPGGAATQIQHLAPMVMERINAYFGFAAIGALKLIQAPLPPRPQTNVETGEDAPEAADHTLETSDPDSLDAALDSLGRHVAERTTGRKSPVDKDRG